MGDGTVCLATIDPGEVSTLYHESVIAALQAGAVTSRNRVKVGSGQIVNGRNDVAEQFLQRDDEWLMMVDADMGFDHEAVGELLRVADPVERPIVGGLCFSLIRTETFDNHVERFAPSPTVYRLHDDGEADIGMVPMMNYPSGELIPCDGTGAAFMLVHRTVLEAVKEKFGNRQWFTNVVSPYNPEWVFSEDISFCLKARACGFPLYVHAGVRTVHDKGFVHVDEDMYFEHRRMMSLRAAA